MTTLARTLVPALLTLTAVPLWAEPPANCQAHSSATVTPVVELYTSEGCSSCPPADRWLSKLKADSSTVALAFHVDYWDRLGWKDRFASPSYTQRQAMQQASNGARFGYTPQVVVDGADRKDWSDLSSPPAAPKRQTATVALTLTRDGERFNATVLPLASTAKAAAAPIRLAAYWAVTEQGHVTAVKAGENQGVTLTHDFVVREYLPVAAWTADAAAPTSLQFSPSVAADAAHPRQVNMVVVDAANGRPLQALKLGC
jgi:hypothetical protein